jgi:hypothetical protein
MWIRNITSICHRFFTTDTVPVRYILRKKKFGSGLAGFSDRRQALRNIVRFPVAYNEVIIEVDQLLDHQESLLEAGEEASRFQRLHRLILRSNCIFRRSTVHREGWSNCPQLQGDGWLSW